MGRAQLWLVKVLGRAFADATDIGRIKEGSLARAHWQVGMGVQQYNTLYYLLYPCHFDVWKKRQVPYWFVLEWRGWRIFDFDTSNMDWDYRRRVQRIYDSVAKLAKQISPQDLSVNKRLKELSLIVGDRVVVQDQIAWYQGKLKWKWENYPFVAFQQPNLRILVYEVQPENGAVSSE